LVTPVAPWGSVGGTATASRNFIELLSERVDLHVCCLRFDRPGPWASHRPDTTVFSGEVSALRRRIRALLDFRPESFADRQFQRDKVRASFAELLAEQCPEFVIFDHIYSSWLIDAVRNRKTIVTYIAHDDMVAYAESLLAMKPGVLEKLHFRRLRSQYLSLQTKVLERVDYLLTLTAEDGELLGKACPEIPRDVMPFYLDGSSFVREYPVNFTNLLVTGSFDTWEKQKGLIVFLENIFPPLVQMFTDLRLVVAGRFAGALLRKLSQLSQVTVVNGPSAAEMRNVFHGASAAAVLDLQASGLKIKTIELAAAGLPLVSWDSGLVGTKLENQKTCLSAHSNREFTAQLARLISDPELRRRIGTAARATVESEFSKQTACVRLETLKLFGAFASAGAMRSAPR
jgi:glycosyltransferase involved in cell wall biosynthesis